MFDSSRVVRAVIRQVAALGQFMPLRRHNVPSLRHAQKKAEDVTNRAIRAVIVQHVAFGAIPSGVPVTALPSCFSFSCPWHLVSAAESACRERW